MPPDEWLISRICEEFHCTPLEALEQPLELTLDIIGLRAYSEAKQMIDTTEDKANLPQSPMIEMVWAILEDKSQEIKVLRDARRQKS